MHALCDVDEGHVKALAELFYRPAAFNQASSMIVVYVASKADGLQPLMDKLFAKFGDGLDFKSGFFVIVFDGSQRECAMHIPRKTKQALAVGLDGTVRMGSLCRMVW